MKPYSRKSSRDDSTKMVFNYRLSRARRVTENAFGLLSQVFRVFYHPIKLEMSTCDDLVWVACILHNMLRDGYLENNKRPYYEYDHDHDLPPNSMLPIRSGGGFLHANGFEVRERLKHFFNNEGSVSWQR